MEPTPPDPFKLPQWNLMPAGKKRTLHEPCYPSPYLDNFHSGGIE